MSYCEYDRARVLAVYELPLSEVYRLRCTEMSGGSIRQDAASPIKGIHGYRLLSY
jgi:hypothetical protein